MAFRLITPVRCGTLPKAADAWSPLPTLGDARAGAAPLLQLERVVRVMIVRDEPPRAIVKWLA